MVDPNQIEENVPIELLQKGITISDSEAETHPFLKISEIDGTLLKSQQYIINAKGVSQSLRSEEDGIAMFGLNKKNLQFEPDVELNIPQDKQKIIKNPMIFLIYYRRDYQKFYLETVDENKEIFFIFVLLDHPHLISNDTIVVSVQNYNFKIQASGNKKEVTIEYGQGENLTKKVFNNEQKTTYYIGRKSECDIQINESEVSREQAMIYYEKGNWYIKDGGKENQSASGTWLYIDKNYHIEHSFTFKLGPSKMKVDYDEPQAHSQN